MGSDISMEEGQESQEGQDRPPKVTQIFSNQEENNAESAEVVDEERKEEPPTVPVVATRDIEFSSSIFNWNLWKKPENQSIGRLYREPMASR